MEFWLDSQRSFCGKDPVAEATSFEEIEALRARYPNTWAVGYFSYDLTDIRVGFFDRVDAIPIPSRGHFQAGPPQSNESKETYIEKINRAKRYIREGDIYQVNLSHRFRTTFEGDPAAFYARLRTVSPAPFSAFLRFGDRAICCASPERFFCIRGRIIQTRPIKGTVASSVDPAQLLASEKNRAELVMIVDLLRNDLGRICDYGSVEVKRLFELESYAQVHHLVATIEGRLRADVTALDALKSMFPGGSITGAPKIRAMQIIKELETAPRDIYTGCIGYIAPNGDCDFNIAIRTAYTKGNTLYFHAGGGIVADSDPESEWDETLAKARGILDALAL